MLKIIIKNYYNTYYTYTKYILILLFFWLSINTGSKYLDNNLIENLTNNTLNFVRSILPYVIAIYLLNLERIYKKNIFNLDYFFIFFGLYGFFQILGLIYQFENLKEHYWVVCLYSALLFYKLIKNKNDEKLINFLFISNIIFVSSVFLIFIFITFKENILSTDLLYYSRAFSVIYDTEQLPRSSGLSRMALIIFIFLNSLYFSKICNSKQKTFILIKISLLISIILLLQSRGAILSFIIIFMIWIMIFKIKKKIIYFLFTIIIPILIFSGYPNLKNFLINKQEINIKSFEIKLRPDLIISDEIKNDNYITKISQISNNRIEAWNFLIQIFFNYELTAEMKKKIENSGYDTNKFNKLKRKNILTGYGPQADRYLMYNKSKISEAPQILGPFGYNASNGIIYSLVCSGILGLLCYIVVNIIITFQILKVFLFKFKSKNLVDNPILIASIFSILFLQLRSLFENSFSVFGVDLLILITSYLVVQNEYRKLKS